MIATITEIVSSSAGLVRVLPSLTGGEGRRRGMICIVSGALYGLYRGRSYRGPLERRLLEGLLSCELLSSQAAGIYPTAVFVSKNPT
jgi:hypothetical protein